MIDVRIDGKVATGGDVQCVHHDVFLLLSVSIVVGGEFCNS